jgi:hypothetical protein
LVDKPKGTFSMSVVHVGASRRAFLFQLSALGIASAMPAGLAAQGTTAIDGPIDLKSIEEQASAIPSADALLKFQLNGTRKPFAGNTVICHLPVQCAMRDAMVPLHEELARSPLVHKLGLTSTDSYHMTVFPGANDQGRSVYGWPSYVPLDATIEECNRLVGERMAAAQFHCRLPLRVRVDVAMTLNYFSACTLRMVPVDAEENAKLRSLRDQLADVYGFRTKGHDEYVFHITMSYQMARFTAQEQVAYRRILRTHLERIVRAAPVLELAEPEYCVFPDMFRFEPVKLLVCL